MSYRALLVAVPASLATSGLVLLLASQAWAGETDDALTAWEPGTSHTVAEKEQGTLPQLIVQHLSRANVQDESHDRLDAGAPIAGQSSPGFYSLLIDIDHAQTDILSPSGNSGTFTLPLTNTIALGDFSEITTVQQSSGLANATANLVLLVNASLLDELIEELFHPHETLLETTVTSLVDDTGSSGSLVGEDQESIAAAGGQKVAEDAVASSALASTLANILQTVDQGAVLVEIREKISSVGSPHGNVIDATSANNLVELNNLFLSTTTLQQQAGAANVQLNLLIEGSNDQITVHLHK